MAIVERLESVWLSVWTGVFYTGNEFKQVQLIQVMNGEQEGSLKKNVEGPPEGRLGSRIVAQQGMGDKVTRGN